MKKYSVGIGCIGSGVGQSVVNSCRLSRLPIRTVGFGTNPFAYGAYDCDAQAALPTIYENDFINSLINGCRKHEVQMIIPGMDDEVLVYARNREHLESEGLCVPVPDEALVALTREKERMCEELNKHLHVFVRSYSIDTIRNAIDNKEVSFPLIAKPRSGFASRGIKILLESQDLTQVGPESIIQELAIPHKADPNHDLYLRQIENRINPQIAELSIQLLVSHNGQLLGRMASYNKLQNGVPIEILPVDMPEVWEAMDTLLPLLLNMGLRGPVNIQGRLTDQGLRFFEMNPRFTGITGLRALMGFNEVEACIRDCMGQGDAKAALQINPRRFGARQTADKTVSLQRNATVVTLHNRLNTPSYADSKKPVILLSGSTGYLGHQLLLALHAQGTHQIWTLDRSKQRAAALLNDGLQNVRHFDHHDLQEGKLSLGHVDLLLHSAFALPHQGPAQMADSLGFTQSLITRAAQHQVPSITNISSQAVYGLSRPPLWSETLAPAPDSAYGQAKYAAELMVAAAQHVCAHTMTTSLRLATICGGATGMSGVDVVAKLVRQALEGRTLNIVSGDQRFTRLDIRDAVAGILAIVNLPESAWHPVYNIDTLDGYTLSDIAMCVAAIVADHANKRPVEVVVSGERLDRKQGMDCRLISRQTNWASHYTLTDTIHSVVSYMISQRDIQ